MPSPNTAADRRCSPRRTALRGLVATASSVAMAAILLTAPSTTTATAASPNPVTPGNFTGRGFDQCDAPNQRAMDAWLAHSPFRAVGIYISGNSRFCREQRNLTPAWVRTQLAKGWRLLPITLGPQASCLDRFPRYGKHIDPTINPSWEGKYAAARRQAILEGRKAIYAARDLGIVPGSTIYYDLEGFNLNHSVGCRNSALWFLSAWTDTMHNSGYASGVYSSAGSGIVMLDQARRNPPKGYTNPDQLWIARWDGKANTSTTYISDEGWKGQRIKQYLGGHKERHGGVTINIDSNWLDVRTPRLPGRPAPSDPAPTPDEPKPTTGTYDPKCTRESINAPNYGITRSTHNEHLIVPLQCLLKQQGRYNREVTGTWNRWTTAALNEFQGTVRHARRAYASRNDWISALSRGGTPTLRLGSTGPDVIRVQRAMNAATLHMLDINGVYDVATRRAVKRYQHKIFGKGYGNMGLATWQVLHRGRL